MSQNEILLKSETQAYRFGLGFFFNAVICKDGFNLKCYDSLVKMNESLCSK